jgi:hypothetical protein
MTHFSSSKKFVFQKKENKKLFFMTISSPEREAKKVKIAVDRNPVETSFERWACDLKKGYDIFYNFCSTKKATQQNSKISIFEVYVLH